MESLLKELETGIERYRQINCCNVASITILALDYLLTFELEVSLIWGSRWNAMKVLFLIARYMPFIDVSLVFYHQTAPSLTLEMCDRIYSVAAWMFIFGIGFSEIILTLRTWAVWGKDKRLMYGLPAFYLAIWVPLLIVMGRYINTTHHEVSPIPERPELLGCIVSQANRVLSICFILSMVYDGGILLLVAIRAFSAFKHGNSYLMRVVYRDGIIYYIYLFVLGVVNTIVITRFPPDYVNLLIMMERVIHSVLSCRVILHIRDQGRQTEYIESYNSLR